MKEEGPYRTDQCRHPHCNKYLEIKGYDRAFMAMNFIVERRLNRKHEIF